MEKPYRDRKKIVRQGNSSYVIIPAFWIAEQERRLKKKMLTAVTMEIYDGKIVITPAE